MNNYLNIKSHYEDCLFKYGDSPKGLDWPNSIDMFKRYEVMLELVKSNNYSKIKLLDFGCGTGNLLNFIQDKKILDINYVGYDISQAHINICNKKFPDGNFYCIDILKDDLKDEFFDYVIANGVFTVKNELSYEEMFNFMSQCLLKLFHISKYGIAINFMSKNVDWERSDLFHVSLDVISNHVFKNLSRNFVIRNDYGLYEFTLYVYR